MSGRTILSLKNFYLQNENERSWLSSIESRKVMRTICISILLVTVALYAGVRSQTPPSSAVTAEMRAEANKYYQASDWEKAAAAYEKIVAQEPANPNAKYRLGIIQLNLDRTAAARVNLAAAFAASPNAVYALALARAYARSGDKPKTFETIEASKKIGGIAPETLNAEKDFAAWKDDPEFKDLVRRSDLAVNPCKASAEFRQFDFWIGEWDVRSTQGGVPSGTSSVQLILGQCIIFENWAGGSGTNGKSFNIYDTNDKKWHQTWVDDKGTFTHYIGGLEGEKMVVVADTVIGGKATLAKMTFSKLPNGEVRQHGENSTDGGKTWTTSFDLTYARKK